MPGPARLATDPSDGRGSDKLKGNRGFYVGGKNIKKKEKYDYTSMHTQIYILTNMLTRTYIRTWSYIHIHTYLHMHTHKLTHIRENTRIYTYTQTNKNKQTYTYTRKHTYVLDFTRVQVNGKQEGICEELNANVSKHVTTEDSPRPPAT